MLVREAIIRAYYLSNKVGRDFQTVTGAEISDGLKIFNSILTQKNNQNQWAIPYYTHGSFPGVVGQEEYTVNNLLDVETFTFNKDSVRYSMNKVDRFTYFEYPRANSINSLPFQYYFERINGKGKIYMYYFPDQAYTFEYVGKVKLTNRNLNNELDDYLDDFYQTYLQYESAYRIANFYNIPFSPEKMAELMTLRKQILFVNDQNLQIVKRNPFRKQPMLNYAMINFPSGFTP